MAGVGGRRDHTRQDRQGHGKQPAQHSFMGESRALDRVHFTPRCRLRIKNGVQATCGKAGKAAFMRGWAIGYMADPSPDSPIRDRLDKAPLPSGAAGTGGNLKKSRDFATLASST